MEEINKKLKEWGSICRISNIKEDPLTFSYSDMLSFAKYYHESQAKNNESLHLVSKCCDEHIEERDLYVDPSDGRMFCNQCGKILNTEIMKIKRGKVKFNVC